ncbi:MAG: BTAD domain-containing putative transcriptional regulator [Gemmatimonadales bacterium]
MRLRTFGGLEIEGRGDPGTPKPGPRRLALLAVVAAAGPRGISRERVRAIFWPDADSDPARQALRQTLYALQRDVGARVVAGGANLRLDQEAIASDVADFRGAVARRDWRRAVELYRGPFAAGLSLPDVPEFQRWLEDEQADLAREARMAAGKLACEADSMGDRQGSVEAWGMAAELDPMSARVAVSYMSALAATGDRSGAIAYGQRHAALVRRELDAEPEAIVTRLADELRVAVRQAAIVRPSQPVADRVVLPSAAPAPAMEAAAGARRRSFPAAAMALVALLVAMFWTASPRADRHLVLAVADLRDLTMPDSSRSGAVLSGVLTTSLARLGGIDVIANTRIVELLNADRESAPAGRRGAARRAGATEVIEGELVATGDGRLRLDLRRVDVVSGTLRGGYSVSGTNRLVLVDSATVLLAAGLRVAPPAKELGEVTSTSPTALRLLEDGLSAYYDGRTDVAQRLFRAAMAEDTTFAMAAYYSYRAGYDPGRRDPALETLVLRLSSRATDRDRLFVRGAILADQNDTLAVVMADSLATRFPNDAEALFLAARLMSTAKLIDRRSRALFERAIALDSAAGTGSRPCLFCTAMASLASSLRWADNLAAADSVVRRLIALRPADAGAIANLALLRFSEGSFEAGAEAMGALEGGFGGRDAGLTFVGLLLTGRLEEADRECGVRLAQLDPREVGSPSWLCPIVWRNQGRLADVAALVFSGRLPDGRRIAGGRTRDPVGEYLVGLETSQPALARRVLDETAPRFDPDVPPGLIARDLAWSLTRRGTAAAAAGDIEGTRRLADSAEVVGRASLFGRDRLLHYFLRGLVARAAGDHETAADFFRRSIFSPTFGYTRANYELAGCLLALHRPTEAVTTLQAALRGGHDGANLYVTRTEIHERLAEAFAAAGRADSAAVHYLIVERAWRRADPQFAPRIQRARDFLRGHSPLKLTDSRR